MASNLFELSAAEVAILREDWEPVKAQAEAIGILLFRILFEKFPEYEQMFEKLREGEKELLESARFRKHAVERVIGTLSRWLGGLEEMEAEELITLGARHAPRGVNKHHFKNLEGVILETLRRGLGAGFTHERELAWQKFLCKLMQVMVQGLEPAYSK